MVWGLNISYHIIGHSKTVAASGSGPTRVGLVVSVSASHTIGREFDSRPGHTKDHHKMVQTASLFGTQCIRVGV